MERYSSRTVDELGRLVLHSDLRQRLGLETGDSVSFTLVDTIIILQKAEDDLESACATSKVSELGMIDLPVEQRRKLGWETKDKVALYHTDNMVILKLAEKALVA